MTDKKRNGSKSVPTKEAGSESVQVVVRCRPMNKKEVTSACVQVVDLSQKTGEVAVVCPNETSLKGQIEHKKVFTFDAVFDCTSTQQNIYDEMIRPLVSSVLEGFNATIFAYGQTGTGKTFTMEGIRDDANLKGIIPRSFEQIFGHIEHSENMEYLVRVSYMEIYQERIRDLLEDPKHPRRHEIRQSPDGNVYVEDLMLINCKDVEQIEKVMYMGNLNRTIGATNMNEHSSRSHAIFQIRVEMSDSTTEAKYSNIKLGTLNLVDLAGSERQAKTGCTGERLKEASQINLSLSALGNVISALVNGAGSHIPYRDSKLTRLLQDSLGGNSRTLMIANIGPANYNLEETMTTLRYAHRAKSIQNKPHVNEDPKDTLMKKLKDEIAALQEALLKRGREEEGKRRKREEKKRPRKIEKVEVEDISDENILNDEDIKQQNAEADELMSKIQTLEGKMVRGGKNIIDHTNEQQRALEKSLAEIAERKRKEAEMRRQLEQEDESFEIARGNYQNLQQEVDSKTKKLKRLVGKLASFKQELEDNTEVFNKERRDLEDTQSALIKELKLKKLIIDNFLPPEHFDKLLASMQYDEIDDTWKAGHIESCPVLSRRPLASPADRRPTSQYSRVRAKITKSPRYRIENVIDLELEKAPRNTMDYEGPAVAPKILAILDEALQVEDNIDIDASKMRGASARVSSRARSVSATASKMKRTTVPGTAPIFPKPRGLVPK